MVVTLNASLSPFPSCDFLESCCYGAYLKVMKDNGLDWYDSVADDAEHCPGATAAAKMETCPAS